MVVYLIPRITNQTLSDKGRGTDTAGRTNNSFPVVEMGQNWAIFSDRMPCHRSEKKTNIVRIYQKLIENALVSGSTALPQISSLDMDSLILGREGRGG